MFKQGESAYKKTWMTLAASCQVSCDQDLGVCNRELRVDAPFFIEGSQICRGALMKKSILKKTRVLYRYLSLCGVQVFFLKFEIQMESWKFNPWLKMDLRSVSSASECQSSLILD